MYPAAIYASVEEAFHEALLGCAGIQSMLSNWAKVKLLGSTSSFLLQFVSAELVQT